MFTQIEKDRMAEILFYLYFTNKDTKFLENIEFWNCISNVCKLYDVDNMLVSRAARVLFAEENSPSEIETWYLLNKLGVSVRPIRKLTGIYWQKQKNFAEIVEKYGSPTVKRTITDAAMRKSIREFIIAVQDMFGAFSTIEGKFLDTFFSL